MNSATIVVPLVPVSVNHYVRHVATDRGTRHYKTDAAKSFRDAVCYLARGQRCAAKLYQVRLEFFVPKGWRGDLDNLAKVALDALVAAGVLHSDSAVERLTMEKRRDEPHNPRTIMLVEPYTPPALTPGQKAAQ